MATQGRERTRWDPPVFTRSGLTYGFFLSLDSPFGDGCSASLAGGAAVGVSTASATTAAVGSVVGGAAAGLAPSPGVEMVALSKSRPSEFDSELMVGWCDLDASSNVRAEMASGNVTARRQIGGIS